jgi:TolB-like protein/tetratricopeptide (TPR) repeat protein
VANEPGPGPNTIRTAKGAVFLSYASEDAPAAQRICAALRGAGIEVWFDQSELRGGDAWDAAIRKQIRSCALFIPIISANAHARTEGYFRLEWKLAVDRSHLLAPDQAFMVPVAIDQTPQSDERLPDRFRELQWTRLPDGNAPPEFVERIRRLLSPQTGSAARVPPSDALATADAARNPPHAGAARYGATPSTRSKSTLWIPVAAAVAVVAAIALYKVFLSGHAVPASGLPSGLAAVPAAAGEKSIAVLPFADESERKDQGYFSDGLSDELIDMLAKIPGLRVPARTSSFYFKGREATLPEIGRVLKVSNVLEGSVRKSGSALRVSAEVIRIADDKRVWSETYDRTLDDVFKVQDDIAGSVVSALKVSMLGEPSTRAAPTNNTDAYEQYLRAREAIRSGQDAESPTVLGELKQAVALDPSFAQAWGLIGTYYMNAFAGAGQGSYQQVRQDALSALQRSVALNPGIADTHEELARLYYMLDWDSASARTELDRGLALDPKNTQVLWLVGYIDDAEGRFDDSLATHSRIRDLDPLFVDNYRQLGNAYYRSGRLAEGETELSEAIRRFPTATTLHYRLGLILLAAKKFEAALAEFAAEQQSDFRMLGMPLALDRLGRKEEADKILAQALTTDSVLNGAPYQVAIVYANRGDTNRAFEWLSRGYRLRDTGMHWMKYDPLLKPLKNDPRFKALLDQMHQS